jgi:nickel-dependent lactate racemase
MERQSFSKKRKSPIEIPYGKGKIALDLPKGLGYDFLRPNPVFPAADPLREVTESLENPLGDKRLEDFSGARSIAIAISDETRPVPYGFVLLPLLEKLRKMGISNSAVHILIASGLHKPMPPSRFSRLLPAEVIDHYFVTAHDANRSDLEYGGKTSRGTPVFVNPLFYKADARLAIGLIDPHQFVGFTGGVKCAAIGLAGAETIEANHSMLSHPQASIGEIVNNPVRQDIEEIGKLMGVHFVTNVVLDESNHIIKAFSGDPWVVENIGSEFCRKVYEIKVSKEYDVVIASPGGYPKDIDLYQAQKGLAHAIPLVRQGGDVILLAECPDGHGNELFYETMEKYRNPQEVVMAFQREKFRMGVHKAFLWARSLTKARVYLYSNLSEELNHRLMTTPVKNIEELFLSLKTKYPRSPKIAVMPKANSTYARVV